MNTRARVCRYACARACVWVTYIISQRIRKIHEVGQVHARHCTRMRLASWFLAARSSTHCDEVYTRESSVYLASRFVQWICRTAKMATEV